MSTVFVTGGTGFLAGWIIRKLLKKGYEVRTNVRYGKKISILKDMLAYERVCTDKLSFAFSDLTKEYGWDKAMKDL